MSKCAVHCPSGSAVASVLSALCVVGLAAGGLWVLSSLGAMIPVFVPYIVTPIALVLMVRFVVKTTRQDLGGQDPAEAPEPEPEPALVALVALPAPRKALPATQAGDPKITVTVVGEPVHSTHTIRRNQP